MAQTDQKVARIAPASPILTTALCFAILSNVIGPGKQGALAQSARRQAGSQSRARTVAQTNSIQSPLSDLDQFPLFPALSLSPYKGQIVASDNLLSPLEMEQPSLSWIEDQIGNRYGSDRLVERWRAYRAPDSTGQTLNYVDVIVNESIWDLLNYFERYAFISQFGTAAKYQGYNLRVFHTGDEQTSLDANGSSVNGVRTAVLRGAYFCNFEQSTLPPNPVQPSIPCNIVLDESSLRTRGSLLPR